MWNYFCSPLVSVHTACLIEPFLRFFFFLLKAVFSVVGTVMDWEETALSAEFTFVNPNEKGRCGCGESFNV